MKKENELNGIWHNQYGSEMKIEIDSSGRISGKFRTAVGRSETKKDWQDTWYELLGFLNQDLISFVVNFGTGAIYTVTGRLSQSRDEIETLSFTIYDLPEQDHWRSVTTASVKYKRGPA